MKPEFDFIVVGAGSAGSVLAERLSKDGRASVLLLEEGPKPNWLSAMPKGFGKLLSDPKFAHFFPVANDAASPRVGETWVRGKMFGGSSGINGMVWIRGAREDYDALAEAGNTGWNWEEMLRIFRSIEDHHLGADESRGEAGPVAITTNPNRTALADAFIAAGGQAGLAEKDDQNGPVQEGVGYAQWNIDARGRRVSAARAFLDPARGRSNLECVGGLRIDRVLFEDKKAVGVLASAGGETRTFKARRAVILCAGALGTPRLLQLSGIGDAARLAALGIDVVHHSPFVGERMREHIVLPVNFRLRRWRDSDNRDYGGPRLMANVLRYLLAGKGPMARGAAEAIAFVRASAGANRPDTQIMFNPYSLAAGNGPIRFEDAPGMHCYSYILRPDSEGHVRLTSAQPEAPLTIDPNYLHTDYDRRTAVAGTRAVRHIMTQPALNALVVGETDATAAAQSDDEILDLYARLGRCGYHAVGTAAMGTSETDVVDPQLQVRGVSGLFVADCSVFPRIPSGNTNAPAMAVGWRASEILLGQR
ncbi:GMC family oxidoreductase [Sphingomonas sp. 37zxx]|uniref:GMC family oxidoreductase n=1 Tax=Sphingomonas sp. 37zxx TaxID=1550073 RepID=UPI00053BE536|nr:GMC family oxidoreductase N-terminal domain-containing protein [Sphingomonas sp. 37zxx]